MTTTIVVGAGAVGLATAYELAKDGHRVQCIADPGDRQHMASFAAGAMLGAFAEVTANQQNSADRLETAFRIEARGCFEAFADILEEETGAALAVRHGTFIVANASGKDDEKNINQIAATALDAGEAFEWVEARDVPGYRPHQSQRPSKVLHLPNEGCVDSHQLMAVLRSACEKAGVEFFEAAVRCISADRGDSFRVERMDGVFHAALHVVLCAGIGTQGIIERSRELALDLPKIEGGKGTSLLLRTSVEPEAVIRTPNRDFACGSHLVSLGNGCAYLGATNRIGDTPGTGQEATAGEIQGLLHSGTSEINTILRTAEVVAVRVGTRPLAVDGYPLIGATNRPGIWIATGTYRNGILEAPAIAEIISNQIAGVKPPIKNPFEPTERATLLAPVNAKEVINQATRDLVSFIQEPHGSLPFNRADELSRFIGTLLLGALIDDPRAMEALRIARAEFRAGQRADAVARFYYTLQASRRL